MRAPAFILAGVTAAFASAACAEPIDPCSLLGEAEMVELGLPKESAASRESQPGGIQACKYQLASAPNGTTGVVSVIVSQAVPERVLQLRALQAKAQNESTPAQLQARGEYHQGQVMCKVVSASQQETSQCLGSTDQSVVALAVSRPNPGDKVTYPASQLRIIAELVSRVMLKGG
jgi:hypothetical protein